MSEITLQWISFLKVLTMALFACLYGFGGISGKWKRRFLAPFVYVITACLLSYWQGNFHWAYLGYYPLMVGALSMGYGGNNLKEKLVRRGLFGLTLGVSPIIFVIYSKLWLLFGLNVFICILVSVLMGVLNPSKNARSEETIIGGASTLLPMFLF